MKQIVWEAHAIVDKLSADLGFLLARDFTPVLNARTSIWFVLMQGLRFG